MKYIIFDGYLHDYPILFPRSGSHEDVAAINKHIGNVLSAGFVDIIDGQISAHGHSHSLKKESRPIDSGIIQRLFED